MTYDKPMLLSTLGSLLTMGALSCTSPSYTSVKQELNVESVLRDIKQDYSRHNLNPSVLLGFNRWDVTPFDPTNKISLPTYDQLQKELTTTKDEACQRSIQYAITTIDACKKLDLNYAVTGLAQNLPLSTGMLIREYSPNVIIYCLDNPDRNEVREIAQAYESVSQNQSTKPESYRLSKNGLEKITMGEK